MSLRIGNTAIGKVYIGNQAIKKIYSGYHLTYSIDLLRDYDLTDWTHNKNAGWQVFPHTVINCSSCYSPKVMTPGKLYKLHIHAKVSNGSLGIYDGFSGAKLLSTVSGTFTKDLTFTCSSSPSITGVIQLDPHDGYQTITIYEISLVEL